MRTILWDMDGTLSDSEKIHFLAWKKTLEKYDIAYSYEDFIRDFGRSNADLLPELLDVDPEDEKIRIVAREKEANFRQLARQEGLQPLPGALIWLEKLQEEGVAQVVSSSGRMANIVTSVELLGVGNFFHGLVSGATLPNSKPDPTIFLNSAAAVQAEPSECIVVEDSIHGVDGARRAGMSCIAVGQVTESNELVQLLAKHGNGWCHSAKSLDQLSWDDFLTLWGRANNGCG